MLGGGGGGGVGVKMTIFRGYIFFVDTFWGPLLILTIFMGYFLKSSSVICVL